MMEATDFTRHACLVGTKRINYVALERDYRCNDCAGRLTQYYQGGWRIRCARCHSTDFVHERELQRQKSDAVEVLEGLPPELAAQLK
jgi:LSD1 subclass zinc finger protein